MNNPSSTPESEPQEARSADGPVTDPNAPVPPATMSPSQRAEAKEYNRRQLTCDIADRLLDLAFLSVAAFILARPLDRWLEQVVHLERPTVRLAALYLTVTLLHFAVSFALSFYSGHVLEHRYGLSRQTVWQWLWRYAKRMSLTLALGLLMIVGLYWIIWITGPWWWLVAAAAFFLVSVLLGQLAPVLIMPLFYKITRLENHPLLDRFKNLTDGTGLAIEGVYRMDMSAETTKANAMLAGLGSTRRVILGDTLLDGFSEDEIEVIFAHEVGHHVHRHIPKLIAVGLFYSVVGFFLCDRVLAAWLQSVGAAVEYRQFPVYALPALMLTITVFSQFVEPFQNMISRHFERQSDGYALDRTGMKDAYRSAFNKLAKLNKADLDPHPLEVFLFHSHPPIAERLAAAD